MVVDFRPVSIKPFAMGGGLAEVAGFKICNSKIATPTDCTANHKCFMAVIDHHAGVNNTTDGALISCDSVENPVPHVGGLVYRPIDI